ncbi:M24 family metallopeptidase [Chloroflexota bacterium]
MNVFSTSFDYQSRLGKVRKMMDEQGMDAILVQHWQNQYYLSGMYQCLPWYPLELDKLTEPPLIVFKDSDPIFMCTRTTCEGVKAATWIKDIRIIGKEPYNKPIFWEHIADALEERGVARGTIGIEEEICILNTNRKIQSVLPKAQFKPADGIFKRLREIKEPEEIEIIRQSVLIAEASMQAAIDAAKVGVLESELEAVAMTEMIRRGASSIQHIFITSGMRQSCRDRGANWKKIEQNDLVKLDMGCVYKGYGCDIARVVAVGEATEKQKKTARDLDYIQGKILDSIKPGVNINETISLGRDEMKKAGYITDVSKWETDEKGVGAVPLHGIGLGFHDDPSYHGGTSWDRPFESGMVIAIGAIIRYPDFGIVAEDNVVVVPGGMEHLNNRIPRSF